MPISPIDDETLFSTRDVGEALGVAPRTVATWIRDGQLAGGLIGRSYWVRKKDLRKFVMDRFKLDLDE